MSAQGFSFEGKSIGALIRNSVLVVPPNQRSYKWKEEHVLDLLRDVNGAHSSSEDEYFLGTIVLVSSGTGPPQIADGQQRLATSSIIIARARDLLMSLGREQSAKEVERNFLQSTDIYTEEVRPKIHLNDEDNAFFSQHIIQNLNDRDSAAAAATAAVTPSNKRLADASRVAGEFLNSLLAHEAEERKVDVLLRWLQFFTEKAAAVVVTVPDEVGAFRMFETLNDRGLRASQADILKNFLFSKVSKARFAEAQSQWNAMSTTISALEDDDGDDLVKYIRYYWILENGLTREKELAKSIKSRINSEGKALAFLTRSRAAATDYAALWSISDPKWGAYGSGAKNSLRILTEIIRVEQIVPLLFAIAVKFSPVEAEKAFGLLVSWSVRFMIAGHGKAGRLDKPYSELAQKVGTGSITSARQLRDEFSDVPSDAEFRDAFATARVSKTHLARYYLRSIESTIRRQSRTELVPNEDETQVNLEHVLPVTLGAGWDMDPEEHGAAFKLIGNMVLLSAAVNVQLGNMTFDEKRESLRQSEFVTTQEVASYDSWGLDSIKVRQAGLAALAPATWPLTFG